MKTSMLGYSKVFALSLAVMALLIPSLSTGFPTDTNTFQINARKVALIDFGATGGPANNPTAADWASAPVTQVPLQYQVVASANALAGFDAWSGPLPGRNLSVQAIHDGTSILFRIVFDDATKNDSIADVPLFHDSVGILIPFPPGPGSPVDPACIPGLDSEPMIHMGMRCDGRDEKGHFPTDPGFAGPVKCCPVDIMLWRADKIEVENIVANSPGTTVETAETDMGLFHAFQKWDNGRWTVIMGRTLVGPPGPSGTIGNMVELAADNTYHTVFANWDGGIQERNGRKYIGLWGSLFIQP